MKLSMKPLIKPLIKPLAKPLAKPLMRPTINSPNRSTILKKPPKSDNSTNLINHQRYQSVDYISDVHIDAREINDIPRFFDVKSEICILAGDVGDVDHENWFIFMHKLSQMYETVCFVPGNHDFGLGYCYQHSMYTDYTKKLQLALTKFENIHYLDRGVYQHKSGIVIAGCCLWSNPLKITDENSLDHQNRHHGDVQWLSSIIESSQSKQLIIATHYVPTPKLIDNQYKLGSSPVQSSYFVTDLGSMFKGFNAWICGHTHSIIRTSINGIYFGVNAVGYNVDKFVMQTIELTKE